MPSYDTFIFESYALDAERREISLVYRLDDAVTLTERVLLPAELELRGLDSPDLDRALFALHLIAGVSYYKAYLPKQIEVRSGQLDGAQATAWDTIYTKGLGEFFYRNTVDFRGLVNFPATAASSELLAPQPRTWRRGLVPWGGGKDSVVTAELLRESGADLTLFRLGHHTLIDELAKTAGLPLLTLERRLDAQLFEYNKAGALNGHVPITTYMSFLTVVVSLLGGYDSVFFSSERSADFGNITYLGMSVNHQWSKSLEAEQLIRGYIQTYITPRVDYVNPLRPLSELAITQRFATYPQYFAAVSSCNTNWRILDNVHNNGDPDRPRWCGHCPKCAFVFTMLSAFLPPKTLTEMFGKNLYADEALLPLFRELWGGEGFKPFECVGTPDEVSAALYLASTTPAYADTPVWRAFRDERLTEIIAPDMSVERALLPDWAGVPDSVRDLLEGTDAAR